MQFNPPRQAKLDAFAQTAAGNLVSAPPQPALLPKPKAKRIVESQSSEEEMPTQTQDLFTIPESQEMDDEIEPDFDEEDEEKEAIFREEAREFCTTFGPKLLQLTVDQWLNKQKKAKESKRSTKSTSASTRKADSNPRPRKRTRE